VIASPSTYPTAATPKPTRNMSRPLAQIPRPVKRLRAAPIAKCAAMLTASDTQTAVLVIGDFREVQLAQATSALGCPTLLVTRRTDVTGSGPLTVLRLPDAGTPMAGTVLEILPIQQLGWTLAQHRGLCVDGFRHRQPDTKVG